LTEAVVRERGGRGLTESKNFPTPRDCDRPAIDKRTSDRGNKTKRGQRKRGGGNESAQSWGAARGQNPARLPDWGKGVNICRGRIERGSTKNRGSSKSPWSETARKIRKGRVRESKRKGRTGGGWGQLIGIKRPWENSGTKDEKTVGGGGEKPGNAVSGRKRRGELSGRGTSKFLTEYG